MAIIKHISAIKGGGSVNAIKYVEKEEHSIHFGVGCPSDPKQALEAFQNTCESFKKTEGVQIHHYLQSFRREDGKSLLEIQLSAQEFVARAHPGHQALISTHTDTDHWHNHIMICAVNQEDGRKIHLSNEFVKTTIHDIQHSICKEFGFTHWRDEHKLGIKAQERYTQDEREIAFRGGVVWKDELKEWVADAKCQTASYDEFKAYLKQNYGVEVNHRLTKDGSRIVSTTYIHPENQKAVKDSKLGDAYTREGVEREQQLQRQAKTNGIENQSIKLIGIENGVSDLTASQNVRSDELVNTINLGNGPQQQPQKRLAGKDYQLLSERINELRSQSQQLTDDIKSRNDERTPKHDGSDQQRQQTKPQGSENPFSDNKRVNRRRRDRTDNVGNVVNEIAERIEKMQKQVEEQFGGRASAAQLRQLEMEKAKQQKLMPKKARGLNI